MKWEGCSIQAGKSEDKNCVGYSWSHEVFFLVSVINRFFSYKSCPEIQTAILAFNIFIPVLKCFFGTTGVKNYLLMKTEVDINSACSQRLGICAYPKLHMCHLSKVHPNPTKGSWSERPSRVPVTTP